MNAEEARTIAKKHHSTEAGERQLTEIYNRISDAANSGFFQIRSTEKMHKNVLSVIQDAGYSIITKDFANGEITIIGWE